jgi:hypothetical protein
MRHDRYRIVILVTFHDFAECGTNAIAKGFSSFLPRVARELGVVTQESLDDLRLLLADFRPGESGERIAEVVLLNAGLAPEIHARVLGHP